MSRHGHPNRRGLSDLQVHILELLEEAGAEEFPCILNTLHTLMSNATGLEYLLTLEQAIRALMKRSFVLICNRDGPLMDDLSAVFPLSSSFSRMPGGGNWWWTRPDEESKQLELVLTDDGRRTLYEVWSKEGRPGDSSRRSS